MRTVYINTLPHIAIVCTHDIFPDDELLLDYGEAYNNAYLRPQPPSAPVFSSLVHTEMSTEELCNVLPFGDESSDEECDTVTKDSV